MRLLLALIVFTMASAMVLSQSETKTLPTAETSDPDDVEVDKEKKNKSLLDNWHIVLIVIIIVVLIAIAVGVLYFWRKHGRNFEERKVGEIQKLLEKNREELEYEEDSSKDRQRRKREVIASAQHRKMSAIKDADLQTELLKAADSGRHVKGQDFFKERKKLQNAKKDAAQQAQISGVLSGMTQEDAKARPNDLDEILQQRCLNPEIKVLKRTLLVVEPTTENGFQIERKFNINRTFAMDNAVAYIGQLPPDEYDLFSCVLNERITSLILDPSLMQTYMKKYKYVDMEEFDETEVGNIKIACIRKKKQPKTGNIVMKMGICREGAPKFMIFVLVLVNQMPKANDVKGLGEMEEAMAHVQGQSWSVELPVTQSVLFMDSTGTGNAVTLLGLYICRQQLLRTARVNVPVVMKHIIRDRYGCWSGMNTQQKVDALAFIYGTLEVTREVMGKGDHWWNVKQQKLRGYGRKSYLRRAFSPKVKEKDVEAASKSKRGSVKDSSVRSNSVK